MWRLPFCGMVKHYEQFDQLFAALYGVSELDCMHPVLDNDGRLTAAAPTFDRLIIQSGKVVRSSAAARGRH